MRYSKIERSIAKFLKGFLCFRNDILFICSLSDFFVDNSTLSHIWMMYIMWTKYGENLDIIKGHNAI